MDEDVGGGAEEDCSTVVTKTGVFEEEPSPDRFGLLARSLLVSP